MNIHVDSYCTSSSKSSYWIAGNSDTVLWGQIFSFFVIFLFVQEYIIWVGGYKYNIWVMLIFGWYCLAARSLQPSEYECGNLQLFISYPGLTTVVVMPKVLYARVDHENGWCALENVSEQSYRSLPNCSEFKPKVFCFATFNFVLIRLSFSGISN